MSRCKEASRATFNQDVSRDVRKRDGLLFTKISQGVSEGESGYQPQDMSRDVRRGDGLPFTKICQGVSGDKLRYLSPTYVRGCQEAILTTFH